MKSCRNTVLNSNALYLNGHVAHFRHHCMGAVKPVNLYLYVRMLYVGTIIFNFRVENDQWPGYCVSVALTRHSAIQRWPKRLTNTRSCKFVYVNGFCFFADTLLSWIVYFTRRCKTRWNVTKTNFWSYLPSALTTSLCRCHSFWIENTETSIQWQGRRDQCRAC